MLSNCTSYLALFAMGISLASCGSQTEDSFTPVALDASAPAVQSDMSSSTSTNTDMSTLVGTDMRHIVAQQDMDQVPQPDMSQPVPEDMSSQVPDMAISPDMSPTPPPSGCRASGVIHVGPQSKGDASGSAPEHAAPFDKLNDLIGQKGPGSVFCLTPGEYPTGTVLSHGGEQGSPVVIRGASDEVVIRGNFVAKPTNKSGASAFEIRASHLTIESIRCERVGQCIQFSERGESTRSGITLRKLRIEHTGTGINVVRGKPLKIKDLRIEDVMILQFVRGGIFLASDTEGVELHRLYIDMQPEQIGGSGFSHPVGLALFDKTRQVNASKLTILNVLGQIRENKYTQGDGIDGEREASNITIKDSFFAGHRDGCIDSKAREMLIQDTTFSQCKRNIRIWQNDQGNGPRCVRCKSYQPHQGHIFAEGPKPAKLKDFEVYSDNSAKLVIYDRGGSIDVDGLKGSLSSKDRLNDKGVKNSALNFGQKTVLPKPPNPTSFMP